MENLLALLDKIQQISPLSFFAKETIVVQNAGMQHWLNMSLAQQRGISMNIDYALPAQYLWKLIRSLASSENVPDQSPYSREVLTWRIYALLASENVLNDDDFAAVNNYWLAENSSSADEQAQLKRYQLAHQLADLFEQYLIFRPDWIDAWSQGKVQDKLNGIESDELHGSAVWQGKLWQLLTEQQAYNPKTLIADALANIEQKKTLLPPRLSFFGINAMAPIWLDFIQQLSEHLDIHFFHLNPCFSYWGDIQTEKQAFQHLKQWTDNFDDHNLSVGNPLLANLGQQGREFIALLQDHSTIDINAFDQADDPEQSKTLLAAIQQDILTLTDAKQSPSKAQQYQDSSITISSCHSALREVQGLHDWLLHQFNQDPTLTPKDIIVMCPQIENYAPYVDAVFTRGWQELDDNIPPLPCSIADRISKDAEPVIAAFLNVLQLPDSRFQVSELIALLRLPAMQRKFSLALEEIDKITVWLEQACIHWGLDKAHKEQLLHTKGLSNAFTWQQGLSRLLRGFAFGDQASIYGEQLLLPSVEGSGGELLGKLMLIIERLQLFAQQLSQARSAISWQQFLFSLLDELFAIEGERCYDELSNGIKHLAENCLHAQYQQTIPLTIVSDFLNNYFSQPEPGRQFMIGQVTFCSMVPMRSIPFKVVAILGLNDGEFPRQRQPLGFDLLASAKARLGDRSRRGDDRYLFLEAIISARKALYLSYQGRNIKNNTERQPSIVLKEFIDYLNGGYGWQQPQENIDDHENMLALRELAMQPFSLQNYQGRYPSFDKKWLKLGHSSTGEFDEVATSETSKQAQPLVIEFANANASIGENENEQAQEAVSLNLEDIIRFFQHPAKAFAQKQLKLNLSLAEIELDDVEPFLADSLESYLLRQSLLNGYLSDHDSSDVSADVSSQISDDQQVTQHSEQVLQQARLSGKFPDLPTTEAIFTGWQNDSKTFSEVILAKHAANPELIPAKCTLSIDLEKQDKSPVKRQSLTIELNARLPIKNQQLVFYRSSSAKAKDKFSHYLHQLFLQVFQASIEEGAEKLSEEAQLVQLVNSHLGFYFDTKSQKVSEFLVSHIDDAQGKLSDLIALYLQGQQQALLLNSELGERMLKAKTFSQADFETFWQGSNTVMPFGHDDYIQYFWPNCPELAQHQPLLTQVYQPMMTAVQPLKKARKSAGGKG